MNPVVSTSTEYTDNLFLSSSEKKEEFITTVGLGVTASYSEKLGGMEIEYEPTFAIYGKYDENNTLRHDARFSAWKDFDKFTKLEFINRFFMTEDPLDEEALTRD